MDLMRISTFFIGFSLIFELSTVISHSLRRKDEKTTEVQFNPLCSLCTAGVATASLIIKFDTSEPAILLFATAICKLFAKQPWAVCDGISTQFREEFFYVFRRLSSNPSQICGILIPDCADPDDPQQAGWTVLLPPRPVVQRRNIKKSYLKSKKRKLSTGPRELRVLQLTDLHIDFEYTEGSEAECDDPVCCHKRVESPSKAAGFWGTAGKCDIPYRTLENMLQHINETFWIDYILMSGDFVNHFDWNYTVEEHLHVLGNLSSVIKKYFPNTPTYWTLGNHEGVPVNSFAPHFVDKRFWPTWLYGELRNISAPWLEKDKKADDEITFRGSYTTKLMDGLRLIALNTGFCETTNFFLYLNQSDPDGTMSWLVNELYKAEKAGDRVQILAHIPPGDGECLEGWARNYYRVVQRFNETIVGQFFGHVHWDYFTVFYEDMHDITSNPIGVLYSSPSFTTFEALNPAFRIYTVDAAQDFKIINHENYFADLSLANKTNAPEWKLLYSARNAYKMEDMSPRSWNKVIDKIFTNTTVRETFFRYSTRQPHEATCDSLCRSTLLCSLMSGHHNSSLYCPSQMRMTNRIQ